MTLKEYGEGFLKWFSKRIVYMWGRFFYHENGRYFEIEEHDLQALVGKFFHETTDVEVREFLLNDVLTNLKPHCVCIHRESIPFWLVPSPLEGDVIPMRNGLLILERAIEDSANALIDHSSKLFTFTALPYDFVSDAQCPMWLRFLDLSLPDLQSQEFLQEWFGYHFAPHRYYAKMLLMYGQGSDGKTVVCVVLREVLGSLNCSSVGLEQFDPKRTFALAATIGKLGNIVGELNPGSKAAEGLIKQYVAGEIITVEEKYKPAFNARPTAHLTFAANELPVLQDRSDGIWRRLVVIPFSNQILDEAKQDKRLVNPLYWRTSGELPGIFLWALHGRKRLLERGHFTEPRQALALKNEFRMEMNLALSFLRAHYKAEIGSRISSTELYNAYQAHSWSLGEKPITAAQFAHEVRRQFPSAKLSDNPIRVAHKVRHRVWAGIAPVSDTNGTEGTP